MSLPVGGHGSQKYYKLIGRFEAEVIVSHVVIGQFGWPQYLKLLGPPLEKETGFYCRW